MILLVILHDVTPDRSALPWQVSTPSARVIDDDTRNVRCLRRPDSSVALKARDPSLVPHPPWLTLSAFEQLLNPEMKGLTRNTSTQVARSSSAQERGQAGDDVISPPSAGHTID